MRYVRGPASGARRVRNVAPPVPTPPPPPPPIPPAPSAPPKRNASAHGGGSLSVAPMAEAPQAGARARAPLPRASCGAAAAGGAPHARLPQRTPSKRMQITAVKTQVITNPTLKIYSQARVRGLAARAIKTDAKYPRQKRNGF